MESVPKLIRTDRRSVREREREERREERKKGKKKRREILGWQSTAKHHFNSLTHGKTRNCCLLLGRYIQQHIPSPARHIRHIRIPRQRLHNRLARLYFSECHKRRPGLVKRFRNRSRSFRLSLGTDNRRLAFLLRLQSPRSVHCSSIWS